MFDCSGASVIAADRENTELSESKNDTEEKEDDFRKDDEAGQRKEEAEISLVPEKKINSSYNENSTKEVAWMITSPASIKNVIREETASLLITPPQSLIGLVFNRTLYVKFSIIGRVKESAVLTGIQEVAFSPVEGVKKKRLRCLKRKTGTVVPKIKTVWKKLFD
ncbi:hypothetical protein EDC94DRAFT_655849 [Helicostylum pulchrum]|nr:hypothetical protein EDC94DRAFT_655849 [Helicostylum pulchrum]